MIFLEGRITVIQIFSKFLENLFNQEQIEKAHVFGCFVDKPSNQEHLTLSFAPSAIPLQKRWRNNGLSADFVANYLCTFFPGHDESDASEDHHLEVKSAVSYVANELFENAMKYCDEKASYPITFHVRLETDKIFLFIDNSVIPARAEKFKEFIRELLDSDPNELYIEQLEKNADQDDNTTSSGLGFITMMTDYSAKLAWKFQTIEQASPVMAVTTMVELPV